MKTIQEVNQAIAFGTWTNEQLTSMMMRSSTIVAVWQNVPKHQSAWVTM